MFYFLFLFSDDHSDQVKSLMLDIMCSVITETESLSNELLDIILSNFVEPFKSQQKCAYKLARDLVLKCKNAFKPYIGVVCFSLLLKFSN